MAYILHGLLNAIDGGLSKPNHSVAVHRGRTPQIHIRRHAMERAERSNSDFRIVQVLPRHALNLLGIYCINAEDHLCCWHSSPIRKHLFAHFCTSISGRSRATEKCKFQFAFATLDFLVCDTEGKKVDSEHELTDTMFDSNLVTSRVPTKHASVLVEAVECLKFICATNLHLVGDGIDGTISRNIAWHQAGVLLVASNNVLHDHESD
mmetsp:Transcript_13955/g.22970  ORF Transcript_13955/g.22970 Transcript_13955/m.22970 type:complete len:207 (-) Transcript_13955:122-742(-)